MIANPSKRKVHDDDFMPDDDSSDFSFSDEEISSNESANHSEALSTLIGGSDLAAFKEFLHQHQKEKQQTDQSLIDRYANSVVEVSTAHKIYDYDNPYAPPSRLSSRGSGFIVNYDGKPCLVTNAHCAADAALLQVRLASDDTKYTAKVKVIDHDCDLALLEVDAPTFWEKVAPLELGEMPKLRDNLSVYGFPMGGDGFCITEGGISRVDVRSYAESGVELLTAQVDAAINPGNSGGPAIQDGKVIGVAFQVIMGGSMIGYIIPPPVLGHFLANATAGDRYLGFPDLSVTCQDLNNELLRHHFGLDEGQTGVRVKSIAKLSSARGILKRDDILLEVDGHKVKNDGKVDCEHGKRLPWKHLINMKRLGDQIPLKVLRDGQYLTLNVPLLNRANTTYMSTSEYDRAPSYLINSGVLFTKLSDNYIDDAASLFEAASIDLEKLTVKDKRKPSQEIVFVHSVLAHENTKDIKVPSGTIVKEINGTKVRNLRHAKKLLEENTAATHTIATSDRNIVIFKNLAKDDQRAILKDYAIHSSCSRDLRHRPQIRPGCPEDKVLLAQFARSKESSGSRSQVSCDLTTSEHRRKGHQKHR